MSFISTRSRYGLRLLADLAERRGEGPVDLGSIALRQGVPEKYLAKLVHPLKGAGIIRSARGAKGGYALVPEPGDVDLLTIVEVLEGHQSLVECAAAPESCPRSQTCPTHPVWKGLEDVVRNYLRSLHLSDAMAPREPEYYI